MAVVEVRIRRGTLLPGSPEARTIGYFHVGWRYLGDTHHPGGIQWSALTWGFDEPMLWWIEEEAKSA